MAEGSNEHYQAVTLSVTTTEQEFIFDQAVKHLHIRNNGATDTILAFVTDKEVTGSTTTTTVEKQFVLADTGTLDLDLAVNTIKYRTASSTSTLEVIGTW